MPFSVLFFAMAQEGRLGRGCWGGPGGGALWGRAGYWGRRRHPGENPEGSGHPGASGTAGPGNGAAGGWGVGRGRSQKQSTKHLKVSLKNLMCVGGPGARGLWRGPAGRWRRLPRLLPATRVATAAAAVAEAVCFARGSA